MKNPLLTDAQYDFATMVAHDLRAPLTVIRGAIAELDSGTDSADLRERLRIATTVLSEHVEFIVDAARLDTHVYESVRVPINIADEIEKFCALTSALARSKNIQVTCTISASPLVCVDVVAFRHVIQNLLENAVKYTEQGTIAVACTLDQHQLTIRVIDSGIGMTSDELQHAFEPFYRGRSEYVRTSMGSGMGLWMCQRFAEIAQGSLHITSDGRETGTTSTLTLPATSV